MANSIRKAGSGRSPSFAMPSGKIRAFSPCYSSLVQMNNIEHFVHPGFLRDLDKARATLELAKTAVQLDPVDSRAHLCCGWSYVMALREAEAAPHMELACELNDNDPWTLLSCAHYSALLRIDRAGPAAGRAVAGAFAGALISRMGVTMAPFASCAATMPALSRPAIARMAQSRSCRRGGRRRCSISGSRPRRGKRRNASSTEYVRSGSDRRPRPMRP